MVIERPKMRNAEGMDLPHNRLPIVKKPTAVQVKQLHEVGLELRKWEVKSKIRSEMRSLIRSPMVFPDLFRRFPNH